MSSEMQSKETAAQAAGEVKSSSPASAVSPEPIPGTPPGQVTESEAGETPEESEPEEGKQAYLALKYTFFTPKRGDMCGAFCLIYEGVTGRIIHQTVWLTRSDAPVAFKPSENWRSFIRLQAQLGPYDKIWGDKVAAILPDLFTEADRQELFAEGSLSMRRTLVRVENDIRKGFERATHCFFDVSSDIELLTRKDLEKAGLLEPLETDGTEAEEETKDEGEETKTFEGTLIQCLPIIDPVWGRAVSDLTPGDLLEVTIQKDAGGASGLVQKFLESTNQTPIFPVEEVDHREDKTYVYLRISPEIMGLLTLTKDLLLRTKQTSLDKEQRRTALDDLVFFAMLGVALVGLLLAIRYLFF